MPGIENSSSGKRPRGRGASAVDEAARRIPGNVLAAVVFLSVFGVVLTVGGVVLFDEPEAQPQEELIMQGQAAQLARVGLTEAANWFRRQPLHPVRAFAPGAEESDDPAVGLVHEFEIADDVWGRYEVWRASADDRSALRQRLQVRDVSGERGHPAGSGKVWRLRCAGYVYRRDDERRRFDLPPNVVLGTEVLECEISRLELRLPGQAALCARSGEGVTIGARGFVVGGSRAVGIYHCDGTGAPRVDAGEVGGAAPVAVAPREVYDDSVAGVFGVSRQELSTMADAWVDGPESAPGDLRRNGLRCIRADPQGFTQARPLRGRGVLFVEGGLTIEPGSDSRFDGLIYVDGDLTMRGPAQLRGAVVVTGRVLIQGSGGDAIVTYDDDLLRSLRDAVGTYRTTEAVRRVEAAPEGN